MSHRISRRRFLQTSAAVGSAASLGYWSQLSAAETKSPNEKLNLGCIACQGQANFSFGNIRGENIVALCDIDEKGLNKRAAEFPKAAKYFDFRKLLDEQKSLDAVVIATPDHIHAPATAAALKRGLHCYTEKPLTHCVWEARQIGDLARKSKLATQMGTQIHAGDNYRRVVEIIADGAIGPVSEVHVWVGKGWGGGNRPKDTPPVPPNIHWDLWLGPAPERPYHPTYLPFNWRRWWDFGQGTLGDMACHYMDLPFWALGLNHPVSIEAEGPKVHPETAPLGLVVRYDFPKTDKSPAVQLTWYDGDRTPKEVAGHKVPGSGVMFVGDKGQMFADYGSYKLYPEDKFSGYKPPKPTIARSIGHHAEWLKACRDGSPTTCNFDYASTLTESVLLGNVAFRSGEKLKWDAARLQCTGAERANDFVRTQYRQGWSL